MCGVRSSLVKFLNHAALQPGVQLSTPIRQAPELICSVEKLRMSAPVLNRTANLQLPRYTLGWSLNFRHAVFMKRSRKCHIRSPVRCTRRGCLCDSRACNYSSVTWWLNVSSNKYCACEVFEGRIRIYVFVKKRMFYVYKPTRSTTFLWLEFIFH